MADITVAKITLPGVVTVPLDINTLVKSPLKLELAITKDVKPVIKFYYDPDEGNFRIVGTVKSKGVVSNYPLRRKVQLIEEKSGRVIREVWSDQTTGEYSFNNIMGGRPYSVVAYDYLGMFKAVIADNLTPSAMP